MSYRINEGRLNVKVAVDRTIHVLTLEAWETGEPLNLTISRGMKQPQETLQDCVTRQVRDMSTELQAFVWAAGPAHQAPKLSYATGRCTYQLGAAKIHQCMAVAQLTETHLLFLFLSSTQPLPKLVLTQWAQILDSFEPDHGSLPLTTSTDTDDDEDEDGDEET
ncbi:MAG: DcrB-related protein [Pseudomonadota bacterium]